ncbi:unnamed protein product [Brassica oleracea]
MLAGCSSSSMLSPTRRLRSEAVAATVSVHFPMNTQRLDLPCSSSFSRKETPSLGRSISLDNNNNKPIERKTGGCSLKQSIKLPPLATTRGNTEGFSWNNNDNNIGKKKKKKKKKSLKRFAEENKVDKSCLSRVKRQRSQTGDDDHNRGFWFEHLTAQNSSQALPFSLTCSGDDYEEKVWFAPSEVITQPLQSNNPNWANSVITELAGIGDKDIESSRLASGSSTSASSDSRHRVPEPTNGSRNQYSHGGGNTEERTINNNHMNDSQRDFELVNLLTGCLEAIRTRNKAAINHFIARTGELASPRGTTPMTRLISYYIEALALRVARMWPHIFHITTPREFERTLEDDDAWRFLNQATPIPKFIHYTANEMLLRAFEGRERVHIIDFDTKQGLQWPSFFQSLTSRSNPPRHVRITGVGESKHELNETGDRLHGFAEAMNLPFEFHPVVDRLEDVRLWMLHVKEGEAVAVNCVMQMHKTLYDDGTGGAAFRNFVGLVRSTNPVAVVIAEQKAEHDSAQLETRVFNSLKYYSAVFDVMHTHLRADSLMRVKIEEVLLGREIRNIVACEGSHRQERHVGFRQWRRMMEQLEFRSLGVSEREVLQSRMLLRMYGDGDEGFFNVERSAEDGDGGGVTLRWLEQPLYTISAWRIGGSSSF